MTLTKLERQRYIDFLLLFQGHIQRKEIIDKFDIAEACATRDITYYRTHHAKNIEFNTTAKRWERALTFKPAYDTLGYLHESSYFDGLHYHRCALPEIKPSLAVIKKLAIVSCAIKNKSGLNIKTYDEDYFYKAIPTKLYKDHHFYQLRYFCIRLNRHYSMRVGDIKSWCEIPNDVLMREGLVPTALPRDALWNNVIELILRIHPNATHKKALENEYGFNNGELILHIREVLFPSVCEHMKIDTLGLNGAFNFKLMNKPKRVSGVVLKEYD